MKRFFSGLILTGFFLSVAAAAVPFKVDGLRSNGNVEINGSASIGTSAAPDSKAVLDLVSTTKGFLTPRMTTAQRDAISSPTTGLLIYNTDTNTLNQYNGTAWGVVAGSGGGGRNYIEENPDAETNTTGWVTYADAAGSIPVDGTGGSPNITWDRTTSTPLAGDGSFLLTKDAANRQGQGVSFDFTIEREDRGKMLQIDYTYEIASGTYATGDLSWHIYDVTNSRYIQPSAYQVENVGVSSHAQPLTFQTSIDSTSYRLILHVASTSASAYTAKFDSVKVGPQNQANGPPVTDWISYTPTLTWVSGISSNTAKWRQVGDTLEVQGRINISGGVTAAELNISIPSSLTIDTSKLATTTRNDGLGEARCRDDDTTGLYDGFIRYVSTTTVATLCQTTGGSANSNVNSTVPFTWASGDSITYYFKVPIVGWSSNVVVSSSANTRPVAASRSTLSSTTITAGTALQFTTAGYDSHGGFTSNSTYTVRVPGWYRVSFNGLIISGSSANCNVDVNGTGRSILAGFGSSIRGFGAATVQVVAGNTITISCDSSVTAGSTAAVNIFIEKVDGPSQIAADTLIEASYTSNTGLSLSAGVAAIRVYEDKVTDTHNAYNSSTGVFTAPAPGDYMICASAVGGAVSLAVSDEFAVIFRKNSVEVYRDGVFSPVAATITQSARGCHQFRLNATDTLDVQLLSDKAMTTNAVAIRNTLHIHRLGGVN